MKIIMTVLLLSLLGGVSFPAPAANSLDVYKGERRDSRYPRVESAGSSQSHSLKVKIQSKERMLMQGQADRSTGAEVNPMTGILSRDGVIIEEDRIQENGIDDAPAEQYPCYCVWNKVGFFAEGSAHPVHFRQQRRL